MRTSDQTNEIFKALSEAQGEFPEIKKDKRVDVFNKDYTKILYSYLYAELPTIVDAIRPILRKNGLSFTQGISEDGNRCVTKIMHSSGQWIETSYPFAARSDGMQDLGGGFTYARRYSLSGILGIATETDDDANQASGKDVQISQNDGPQAEPKSSIPNMKPASPPQMPLTKAGQIVVRALVKAPGASAKKAGFRWNADSKIWTKIMTQDELNNSKFDFEVEAIS
jgi:hypothetical protein